MFPLLVPPVLALSVVQEPQRLAELLSQVPRNVEARGP